MPARGKHVVYTPGKGTTVSGPKGAKTFVGKGPGPAGTKKIKERSYLEAPTVTASNGQVTTSGFSSPSKAQRAAARTRRTQTRVQIMLKRGSAERKRSSAATEKQFKATEKRIKTPAYKPTGVSAMPSIKAASKQSERDFASEGNKPPVQVKAHTRKAPVGFVPPVKPPVEQHPRAIKQVTRQLKAAERSRPHVVGPLGPEQKKFVNRVAKRTHLSPRAIGAQAVAEEGNAASTEAEGTHNYLNIGPGRSYPTLQSGVRETSKLLNTSDYYAGIRASRGKGPIAQVKAIGDSPCGTSKSLMQQTVNEVGQKGKPIPKALLKKAENLGVNPKAPNKASPKVVTRFKAAKSAAAQLEKLKLPYVWGGGHNAGKVDLGSGVDCSGAVSYVLQKMGVKLPGGVVSGEMGNYLEPGPGAVTVFYNPEHTFMKIGNEYFGTSGSNPGGGAGIIDASIAGPESKSGAYSVGHVPGLGQKVALQLGIKGTQSFPGMSLSPGGTSATINPGAGASVGTPGFSSEPIKLTPQQKYRRTKKALREVGIGTKQAPEEPSQTLKDLERRYGVSA